MQYSSTHNSDLSTPKLAQRHQPSELNSTFNGSPPSFEEYITMTIQMLRQAHIQLGSDNIEHIIAGNAPFILKPFTENGTQHLYQKGILLTHGLTDSPYFMRHLADFFTAQGFLVMAVLLPGHATQPGDLLDITWQEWSKAVTYGINCLAKQVDEVYLGGFSTGATLSVYQSLIDQQVRGLFLFSPALKITSRAAFAHFHKLYSWLMPSEKWVTIQPDTDDYKYESFSKNGAAQMYALTRAVKVLLQKQKLHIPIFTAASADDATVQVSETLKFMLGTKNRNNKMLLYSTVLKPENIADQRLEWVSSALIESKILSSAHTAIVLAATDTHYGEKGHYANCTHYFPSQPECYIACRCPTADIAQGEITVKNLQMGLLKRLMYNPNFTAMTSAMSVFIANLPAQEKRC